MNEETATRPSLKRTRRHLFAQVAIQETKKASPGFEAMLSPDERIKRARPDNPFHEIQIR